jgi:acyl carrier protein
MDESKMREDLGRIFERVLKSDLKEIMVWSYDSVTNWDSLAQVALVLSIEEHWEILIDPEKIPFLETFEDYLKLLKEITKP